MSLGARVSQRNLQMSMSGNFVGLFAGDMPLKPMAQKIFQVVR